jgi:hypothetical protein
MQGKLNRNAVLNLAWIGLLILGVIIQLSPSFALRVSALPTKDLIEVGRAVESNGFARRRLATDIVWLPMPSEWPVFQHDRLYTGPDSRIVLEFSQGTAKLALRPNSLVYIDTRDGKLLIDMLQGEVDVLQPNPSMIILRAGREETEADRDTKAAKESSTPAPLKPQLAAQADLDWRPYPANGTQFLLNGEKTKTLKASVSAKCKQACRLLIDVNGARMREIAFAAGERPDAEIPLERGRPEDIRLTLEDGADRSTLSFSVRDFSEAAFSDSLTRKGPVQLLE